MKTKRMFTLVEIMIVVAIIGILAAIAIPGLKKARENSQKNACIANMKQIDGALESYMAGEGKITATIKNAVDAQYLKVEPRCPADTTKAYTIKAATATTVSTVICPNAKTLPKHVLPVK